MTQPKMANKRFMDRCSQLIQDTGHSPGGCCYHARAARRRQARIRSLGQRGTRSRTTALSSAWRRRRRRG
jgi:hypothetical protein